VKTIKITTLFWNSGVLCCVPVTVTVTCVITAEADREFASQLPDLNVNGSWWLVVLLERGGADA
jgi:hypothetical protein